MQEELIYRIALTLVPMIGDIQAKALVNHFGNATNIFKAKSKELEAIDGMGYIRAKAIKNFTDMKQAEDEVTFINKYKVAPLFITDEAYPKRLLNCYDSPSLLYYKGNADLNNPKVLAIVGTRNNDQYGKIVCEEMVSVLKEHNVLVCSGLAIGIDTIAHKASVKNQLHTIGVLAHGLDRIYPSQNNLLARQMVQHGGLLTDFRSNTNPDRQNFPKRNRIVAGMSDAVVVIQTSKKGGSLITAELANGYNRDVFAIPGRVSDTRSEGCNFLISSNKASLITCADDILEFMGWKEQQVVPRRIQRELFIELTEDEKKITSVLKEVQAMQIDELYFKSAMSSSAVASALLTLEMQGLIECLPGKVYRLS